MVIIEAKRVGNYYVALLTPTIQTSLNLVVNFVDDYRSVPIK